MTNKTKFDFNKFDSVTEHSDALTISSMNEEFRSIKRELITFAFPGGDTPNRNRVMFTSINSGEGKTFTSVNLARSVSYEYNKTVLLVDADVMNHGITNTLSPIPENGLIDYLSGDVKKVSDIFLSTDIEKLKILPVGNNHALANEMFSSERMATLMIELNSRYNDRFVIFDSPPILGVNETIALSHHMDQMVIIVEEGVTRTKDIQAVIEKIPKHVKTYFILNKTLQNNPWQVESEFSENDKVLTGTLD